MNSVAVDPTLLTRYSDVQTHVPLLRVERITESVLMQQQIAGWDALHLRTNPRTPFTSPLWNALWWKHYASNRWWVRDELCLMSVRDSNGALRAVAPMMLTLRPAHGPARLRSVVCFGADRNVTELRGVICKPEDHAAVVAAIARYLKDQNLAPHWTDYGVRRIPNEAAESGACQTGYHLLLPDSWDTLRAGLSRNIKESIRKCYNSLKRAGHSAELSVISHPAECAAALEKFFELHAARHRAANMVPHPDVFEHERDRAFLTDFIDLSARRDEVRIFQLRIGGQVVATRLGFQTGDQLYLYYSGFDVAWAQYSVMTTLLVEAIKWAIAHKLKLVHLSTGKDEAKLRWGPVVTNYEPVLQTAPDWRSRTLHDLYSRAATNLKKPAMRKMVAFLRR